MTGPSSYIYTTSGMRLWKKQYFFILLVLVLSSCSSYIPYHNKPPRIDAVGKNTIAIGVQDHRPYVVSKNKKENFVGIRRTGWFFLPMNVETASGSPLAQDISWSIKKAFNNNEVKVILVPLSPSLPRKSVLKIFQKINYDRTVFIRLMEWKSTTDRKTTLHFNVILEILDNKGQRLGMKQIEGRDRLGKDFEFSVPVAFRIRMQQLINNPEVRAALR